MNTTTFSECRSPVERIATDPELDTPSRGIALCLSGGGYRAMLFHVGSLWRLAELGYLGTSEHTIMTASMPVP